ncbi:TolC family protein [Abyssalbus ytuae]|uniref:TolC family protein n=1 Tax=Abyssalbus ytuae TaxID=2926907 RepID=A0A9E6ZTM9_9FLAO|nr:TolC family protein [Abyssalbus ytuae]UOB16486.1 TolC family protein [Abyssalbus ytuae]
MKKIGIILLSILTCNLLFSQQLDLFIEEALRNNPELQKFELTYNIALEKVNEVNNFPNTEFSAGYFVSEPETRTGAQKAKASVRQMIPWFGSVKARENYAKSLANTEYEDFIIAKRRLISSVSRSYYNLYAFKEKQQVLSENISLLNTYEKIALTLVEVGKASAVDVLKLQLRQNELIKQKQLLEQDFMAEKTRFNKLLNRNASLAVEIADSLMLPVDDKILTIDSLKIHPELIKFDKLYESVEKAELLNQKEGNPMIGFGLDYITVEERPDMNFSENGKDIVMPMVSLSIPVFNNKYASKSKQNKLQQQALTAGKQSRLNDLETMLDQAIKNQTSARISYRIQEENIKKVKKAEEILLKNYETGTVNFNDILDIQELQLKIQINLIESLKNYYLQTIIINYLID